MACLISKDSDQIFCLQSDQSHCCLLRPTINLKQSTEIAAISVTDQTTNPQTKQLDFPTDFIWNSMLTHTFTFAV